MYVTKGFYAGKYLLVKSHTPMAKAPLGQRIKRWRETSKAMDKYNNLRRAEKLQLLILSNFDKGYHVTLSYAKGCRPETYEEAEKKLTKCLYKVSRRLKKKGKQFKYIAVTERGKRAAALHHHLVIDHDADVLAELLSIWGHHMNIAVMYSEGQYKDLAEYLVKKETKEEQTKGKSKYHRSRNLIKPMERTGLIQGDMGEAPYIPKGYELMEGSFEQGKNDVIGVRWQRYLLKELPDHNVESESMRRKSEKAHKKSESSQKCIKRESIWSRLKKKIFGRH